MNDRCEPLSIGISDECPLPLRTLSLVLPHWFRTAARDLPVDVSRAEGQAQSVVPTAHPRLALAKPRWEVMRHMAANPRSSTMRRKPSASTRGHIMGKAGRAAGKSIIDKRKPAAPAKPPAKTKARKPGRPPSAPERAASAPRRTSSRDAALAAQLKAISDDLQAIVSIRNEVHELRAWHQNAY